MLYHILRVHYNECIDHREGLSCERLAILFLSWRDGIRMLGVRLVLQQVWRRREEKCCWKKYGDDGSGRGRERETGKIRRRYVGP